MPVTHVISKSLSITRPTVTVLYAGHIGEGQGLHAILPELARRMARTVCFRVIGDGGRKNALQMALALYGIENIEISSPISRDELIREYQDADVLFFHLNDHEAFKKALPSKLFEYAAMGKSIWAGVAGYTAEFVRSEKTMQWYSARAMRKRANEASQIW